MAANPTADRACRSGGSWRPIPTIVAVVVCWWLPVEAFADRWYVHYENAERALEAEEWSEAVGEIQEALERRGDSGSRVRTYGMRVMDYFPYLKLGIAYHHLGQSAAALEAFDTEERLGAIESSPEALQQLARFRQSVADSEGRARASARQRIEKIVQESLISARRWQEQDRVDEAIQALTPGLAAQPEHPEAVRLMEDLRTRAMVEEQVRRDQEEARENLRRGKDLLEQGDAEAAAGLLRQVLGAGGGEEAQILLRRALGEISAAVAEDERRSMIATALESARSQSAAGRWEEALGRLERIFALEADHREGGRLREEILAARAQARHDNQVAESLEVAAGAFTADRFEEALSAANRVLALDRGNAEALDLVRQAYGRISQRLLGISARENLPPAIRFADRRQEIDGELIEAIGGQDFRLSGVVIDRSPVNLEFLDGEGRSLEGSLSTQEVGGTFITEFRLGETLSPGPAVFTILATDEAGSTSRAEYRVLYRPAWWRSPWPWTVAVAALLALWRTRAWRRRRQRQELRQRRFNPYVAGGPIFDPDLFFGREPLVQKILQTVHNNSLLLFGERRIGKTSLLHQVHRRLEALDDPDFLFLPVYIDLQGTPEERFFATLADQIFEALDPAADRRRALGGAAGYSHHDLFRELHGLLAKLRDGSPKRLKVVLLIDEVDELNHYDPRVNQGLRSLFMKRFAENLAAVVAGVGIRKEWEKEASPWYNFFEEVEVRAIPPEEALRLVVEPVGEMFRFEAGAAERIVALSDGKPFLIQRRCLTLVGRLHEAGRRTITVEDVEDVEAQSAASSDASRGQGA